MKSKGDFVVRQSQESALVNEKVWLMECRAAQSGDSDASRLCENRHHTVECGGCFLLPNTQSTLVRASSGNARVCSLVRDAAWPTGDGALADVEALGDTACSVRVQNENIYISVRATPSVKMSTLSRLAPYGSKILIGPLSCQFVKQR